MPALVVALALVVVAAGCSQPDQVDMSRADLKIASVLGQAYHLPVTALRCPKKQDVKAGASFRCSLLIAGHPLTVVVTQKTKDGDLGVKATSAVLVMAKVRAAMVTTFRTQLKKNLVKADCGHLQVQVVAPGGSVDCTVSDGKQTKHVTIEVQDTAGTVTYAIH